MRFPDNLLCGQVLNEIMETYSLSEKYAEKGMVTHPYSGCEKVMFSDSADYFKIFYDNENRIQSVTYYISSQKEWEELSLFTTTHLNLIHKTGKFSQYSSRMENGSFIYILLSCLFKNKREVNLQFIKEGNE